MMAEELRWSPAVEERYYVTGVEGEQGLRRGLAGVEEAVRVELTEMGKGWRRRL
jgi:hypothetical protein